MTRDRRRELVAFFKRAAGPNLRTVVQYDEAGEELLYGREDIVIDTSEKVANYAADLRTDRDTERDRESFYQVGDHYCTVRLYGDAVILHFITEGGGTAVSLDPDAAGNLNAFVAKCLDHIEGASSPDWL